MTGELVGGIMMDGVGMKREEGFGRVSCWKGFTDKTFRNSQRLFFLLFYFKAALKSFASLSQAIRSGSCLAASVCPSRDALALEAQKPAYNLQLSRGGTQ